MLDPLFKCHLLENGVKEELNQYIKSQVKGKNMYYILSFVEYVETYNRDKFDVKRKNLLSRDYKDYSVDTGLRSYLLGKKTDSDMGHILENIVYFELLRR